MSFIHNNKHTSVPEKSRVWVWVWVSGIHPTPIPKTPDFPGFHPRLRVTPESFFSILLILQAKITNKFITCCYLIDSTIFLAKISIFYKKNVIYLRHKMNHTVFYFGLFLYPEIDDDMDIFEIKCC